MKHLEGLNPMQKKAAEHTSGPLMIIAGAGSGKTKTITHRIVHLIMEGVAPQSILAVTFTNKAAGEMRGRVASLLEHTPRANMPLSVFADERLPLVCTFHSLGVRLLREFSEYAGVPRSFSIWDRDDSTRAIKSILKNMGLDKLHTPAGMLGKISRLKGESVSRADFEAGASNPWEETVANVWQHYEQALKKEGALDFDDLLVKTMVLLKDHENVLQTCRDRWTHITIDEYQDTNRVQFELAELLARPHNNICVVGDIDQNVYSWRGARIEHLLAFQDVFPNTKTVTLEQNYRSTQNILAAANDIISRNTKRLEKTLFTKNEEGEPVSLFTGHTEKDEAIFVAETSRTLIEEGTPAREIAVLYRANFQSRVLEEAFLTRDIPYRVLGTRFFNRKEVKDVLAYARAAQNPKSRGDIARIVSMPPRGIGKKTLAYMLEGREAQLTPAAQQKVSQFNEMLAQIADYARTKSASETLRLIVRASGLETHLMKLGEEGVERLENVKELVSLATNYDSLGSPEALDKLLEDAALLGEQDSLSDGADAVSLMTAHASKGLEFDVVFVVGLEEGLFPHARHDESADEEEERRLFYVALTRARKKVFLSHAMTRQMYGTRDITMPSQFLGDIDPAYIEHVEGWAGGGGGGKVDLIDF